MSARLRELVDGYQNTCVIVAASKLGIFDALDPTTSRSTDELARTLGLDEGRVRRLVRALVVLELVAARDAGVVLPADGALLRATAPGVGAAPLMIGEQYLLAWANLAHSVETGGPAFDRLFGMSAWEHRRQNPKIDEAFNRMIGGVQAGAVPALLDACAFPEDEQVVDVGGGNGHLIAGILERRSGASGVLFDQPHVADAAAARFADRGFGQRLRCVGGSFFEDAVPRGGDVYILQHILHDWDDEACRTILGNCRSAMKETARLLLLECIVDEARPDRGLVMRDHHMMSVLGGVERTLAEYDALFEATGLRRVRTVLTEPHAADVIEARPA
jgi:hypothetical protein